MHCRSSRGFTLVEVLISITILGVVLATVTSVVMPLVRRTSEEQASAIVDLRLTSGMEVVAANIRYAKACSSASSSELLVTDDADVPTLYYLDGSTVYAASSRGSADKRAIATGVTVFSVASEVRASPLLPRWWRVQMKGSGDQLVTTVYPRVLSPSGELAATPVVTPPSGGTTPPAPPTAAQATSWAIFATDEGSVGPSISVTGAAAIAGGLGVNSSASSAIKFGGASTVTGTVSVGPAAVKTQVIYPSTAVPVASVEVMASVKSFALPAFPAFPSGLPPKGTVVLGMDDMHTMSADGQYGAVKLASNNQNKRAVLTIDCRGGTRRIVMDSLTVGSNAKVVVQNLGKLELYVGGDVSVIDSDGLTGADPTKFALFTRGSVTLPTLAGGIYADTGTVSVGSMTGTSSIISGGGSVTIGGSAATAGIYAPNAAVTVNGDLTIPGGLVVCKTLSVTGKASVTYGKPAGSVFAVALP